MSLSAEDQRVAEQITEILTRRDAKGELVFTDLEVRDFVVACVFEFQLDVPQELKAVVLEFCESLEVPETASDEELVAAVKGYFEANPLNDEMMKSFHAVGRDSLLTGEQGYKDSAERVQAMRTTGSDENLNAPTEKAPKRGTGPKRGLK